MDNGSISIEFYAGRYIYLSQQLADLPKIRFGGRGHDNAITVYMQDSDTGKTVRRRINQASPQWGKYYDAALRREALKDQLNKLLINWREDHKGSLPKIASDYKIIRRQNNRYDSSLWSEFRNNDCDVPNDYPEYYKDFVMRSQLEVEVAKVLDSLGLEYKYEVSLMLGGGETINPDMSVNFPEYDRCGFVEALGGLDNMKYVSHNAWKLKLYINAGLYPNRDVALISADRKYFPDRELIRRAIGVMLSAIAAQYVMRIESVDNLMDSY